MFSSDPGSADLLSAAWLCITPPKMRRTDQMQVLRPALSPKEMLDLRHGQAKHKPTKRVPDKQ